MMTEMASWSRMTVKSNARWRRKNRPGSNENTGCAIFKSLSYSSAGYGYAISLQQLSLGRSAVSGDRGIAKVRRRVCIRESHGRY